MAENVASVDPTVGIVTQHTHHEVPRLGREGGRKTGYTCSLSDQASDATAITVRQSPHQHGVQDHAHAPHVRLLSVVAVSSEQFGGTVRVAPCDGVEHFPDLPTRAAKVGDLEPYVRVDEEVLQLEVSVDQVEAVHFANSQQKLAEKLSSQGLVQRASVVDELAQVA